MDNLIPAAIYARFSSHAQREESIEQQLHVCREWARSHGYRIIREYSDSAISGTTDKRPEFQRMIYESERAGFEVLLVYSYDRFARNRYDSAIYKTRLKKNGIRVVAVTMPLDDKPESILFESIMEGYAEYYSANLARNVSRGMMDNALKAKVNGPVPLGYRVEDGKYAIDPEGAKIVRDIFDLYDHNVSASEIARILNRNGYQTRGGRAFSYQSVYKILINER